uniref:Sushi domain-containing protein n=1 Tax=Magallana gigas TaxID=29159 RepID=A0A8W8LTG8_MAGGI
MSCVGQPSIPDGYPTGAASGTPPTVTFVCNPGYTLSGNPTYTCDFSGKSLHLTGNAECITMFIKGGLLCYNRLGKEHSNPSATSYDLKYRVRIVTSSNPKLMILLWVNSFDD